jgi:hypothetical protein
VNEFEILLTFIVSVVIGVPASFLGGISVTGTVAVTVISVFVAFLAWKFAKQAARFERRG